jgi:EpsI family protein
MKRPFLAYGAMLALLVAGAILSVATNHVNGVPPRKDFALFPETIGGWHSKALPDFDERTQQLLGVTDYVNRVFRKDGKEVFLYVGYYRSQRAGETIHSPKNCLPGNGYEVLYSQQASLEIPGARRTIPVNRYVLQKDQEQLLVLYWYETHGRVFAQEYLGKAILVWEAVKTGRTDGALVRIMAAGPTTQAETAASEFAKEAFPVLRTYLAD